MNVAATTMLALLLQNAAIQGIVTRATNDPLSKANVELRTDGANSTVVDSAVTNADGRFVFQNVRPGRYRLNVIRGGYVRPLLQVVVTPDRPLTSVELPMTPTAAIEGRVFNNGQPFGNVEVQALKATYPEGRRVLSRVASAWTNDLGEYRLFWLAPGRYYIAAIPATLEQRRIEQRMTFGMSVMFGVPGGSIFFSSSGTADPAIAPPDVEHPDEQYVPVYYAGAAGTLEDQSAVAIDLRAGSEVTGVTIAVAPVRAHHVKGLVVDGITGKTAEYASIRRLDTLGPLFGGDIAVNRESGSFDVMLLPGLHTLIASSASGSGSVTFQVGDADVENLTIPTTPYLKLRGHATVEGPIISTADLEKLRVSLRRDPPSVNIEMPATSSYSNPLPDGTFSMEGTAGRYRVNIAQLPEGAYVKSIRLGNIDVLNASLKLERQPETSLDVVIGTNPGAITGGVIDERRQAVRDASIVLLPDLRQRTDLYRSAITDASGRFQFDRIPPGDYKIFAWTDVDTDAWFDPDFMRDYENRGQPIRINDGGQQTATVIVITPR